MFFGVLSTRRYFGDRKKKKKSEKRKSSFKGGRSFLEVHLFIKKKSQV